MNITPYIPQFLLVPIALEEGTIVFFLSRFFNDLLTCAEEAPFLNQSIFYIQLDYEVADQEFFLEKRGHKSTITVNLYPDVRQGLVRLARRVSMSYRRIPPQVETFTFSVHARLTGGGTQSLRSQDFRCSVERLKLKGKLACMFMNQSN